jgi:hypothetical protein
MGSRCDDWVYWHFFTITFNSDSLQSVTLYDSFHSFFCAASVFSSTMTNNEFLLTPWTALNDVCLSNESCSLSLSLILRPTVSRPGIKHPFGAYDQICITVRQLWICWCGAISLTRGGVCRLQLLLVLASAAILGFESRETLHHILLSQIRDLPFRRLLRLAGLRWRYSIPASTRVFTAPYIG